MSNISLKKPFKHFATSNLFSSAKVSANESNTAYIQNGEVRNGTPDILWEHTVFIHDIGQIWNRGRYYNSQKYLGKLSMIAKDTSMMFDGITVVTLVDKNVNAMKPSYYDNYPGILPSIVVAPSIVSDIDKVLSLSDKGCDILSTGNYTYNPSASKADNYDVILEDMTSTEQWLVEHGLFSNCYKYPTGANVQAESEFIQKYEEYGLRETNTAVNGLYQDNMMLNGKVLSTNANVTAACQEIASDSGNWLIYILDTQNITNIGDLIEAIQSGVDNDKCIYLQIQEAISMRASAFNIGRGVSTLPFRVYKNGTVDAKLSNESIANIPAATSSSKGLMSSTDKVKLNGLPNGDICARIVEVTNYVTEGSVLPWAGVYVAGGKPIAHQRVMQSGPDSWDLVFCLQHVDGYENIGFDYYTFTSYSDGWHYMNTYNSDNVPDWVLRLFGENEADAQYSGMMSSTDKVKLDALPTNAQLTQTLAGKENVMPLITATGTSLSPTAGNYYRLNNVGTLIITLPTITGSTRLQAITFLLICGASARIKFIPQGTETIMYQEGFMLDAGGTYEVTALWNGSEWTLSRSEYTL